MLDVRRLTLLRELSRRGTIAAVAEALAYTPSAVSQQLSVLEREAGVVLLERSGRRVNLTPAARMLVDKTESLVQILLEAEANLAAADEALSGVLRIGGFPSALSSILTPVAVTLSADHPALELMLSELDPALVADALREERVDIALVQEYDHVPFVPDAGLQIEPLLQETVHLASLDDQSLAAQSDAWWIAGSPGTLCHMFTVRSCEAVGFSPRIRHHVDDFDAVLALVAAGQGIAFVPDLGVRHNRGGVVLTALASQRRTYLAYRRGDGERPVIRAARRAFHDVLAEERAQAI